MADFKTHLTASTLVGVGYGGAALGLGGMPLPACVLAAGLCGASGMLPDIDSGPGRPLREITSFLAVAVPSMLFARLQHYGLSQSSIMLVAVAIYLSIRFGVAELLRRYTVHRGMFHSFVAAAIFGELTYLMLYDDSNAVRWLIAGGVVLGFLSHLCLDEIYSVQWDGRPRLKNSFGTALKVFAHGWWPNVSAYAKFAVLTFLVINEPSVVQKVGEGQTGQVVQDLARDFRSRLPANASLPPGLQIPEPSLASLPPEQKPPIPTTPIPTVAQRDVLPTPERATLPPPQVESTGQQQPPPVSQRLLQSLKMTPLDGQ
jgi:hypothetical protein